VTNTPARMEKLILTKRGLKACHVPSGLGELLLAGRRSQSNRLDPRRHNAVAAGSALC
jgi:hypothetical protein